MTVTIDSAWATVTHDTDPIGPITLGTGSNRLLVFLQSAEHGTANPVAYSAFTIGGVAATADYSVGFVTGAAISTLNFLVWNDAAITSMSGAAVSYEDGITLGNQVWTYATYQDVDQTTPVTDTGSSTTASADSLAVTTTSTSDDIILVGSTRSAAARDVTDWDTLTEVFDVQNTNVQFRAGLAAGVGGDATTTCTGDGFNGDWLLNAIVLNTVATTTTTVSRNATARGIARGIGRGIG